MLALGISQPGFVFFFVLISLHRVLEAGLAFLARRVNYLLKHSLPDGILA